MTLPTRRTWLRLGLVAMLAATLYPPWDFVIKNKFEPLYTPAETDSAEVERHAALWSPPRRSMIVSDTVQHELIVTSYGRPRIDFGVLAVTLAAIAFGTALVTTFASSGGPTYSARSFRRSEATGRDVTPAP